MANKPMLSVERELLERIAKPLKVLADKPYRTKAILELRALLEKPVQAPVADLLLASAHSYVKAAGETQNLARHLQSRIELYFDGEPTDQHLGEPVACDHQWIDDGQFLLVCTACGAQEDYTQALQLAFELGGTDDGSYDLEAEEICEVIRRHAEQSAPVAEVPEGYCIMPRRLTAENGAKALLLGEFKLRVTKECPECCELEEPTEGCSMCDGEGEYEQRHTIPWDQIKFIYSKAVAGLARPVGSRGTPRP